MNEEDVIEAIKEKMSEEDAKKILEHLLKTNTSEYDVYILLDTNFKLIDILTLTKNTYFIPDKKQKGIVILYDWKEAFNITDLLSKEELEERLEELDEDDLEYKAIKKLLKYYKNTTNEFLTTEEQLTILEAEYDSFVDALMDITDSSNIIYCNLGG